LEAAPLTTIFVRQLVHLHIVFTMLCFSTSNGSTFGGYAMTIAEATLKENIPKNHLDWEVLVMRVRT